MCAVRATPPCQQMAASAGDAAQAARCHLIAGNQEAGAKAALAGLRDAMRAAGWRPSSAEPLREALMSVAAEALPQALRTEVLAHAFYLGALKVRCRPRLQPCPRVP